MIKVETKYIKALLLSTASIDIRYYLCGINIVVDKDASHFYGTNGHTLSIYRHMQQFEGEPVSFIAPYSLCKLLKEKLTFITWGVGESGQTIVSMKSGDITYTCPSILGKYPDTSKVIPSKLSGIPGQFQMKYMEMVNRTNKLLGGANHQVIIHHNGMSDASLVEYTKNHNFLTVLMPVRCGEPNIDALKWAMPSEGAI